MFRHWRSRRSFLLDFLLAVGGGAFDIWTYLTTRVDGNGSFRTGPVLPVTVVIVLLVVAAAALLFRRRWPVPVFVITWVICLTPFVFPDLQPFMCLLIAMFTLASRMRLNPAVWSLLATCVVFAIEIINTAPAHPGSDLLGWSVGTFVFEIAVVAVVWTAARVRWRFVHRVSELERRRELEIETAVRAERTSVSRDLHDIISHSVSAMTLQAAGAKAVMAEQPDQVRPALDAIEQTGVQAISELQRLLQVLRSTSDAPEQTRAHDRLSQLPQLIEQARQAGQRVELEITGDPCELDPSVELTCYRVIQEALNNASRHAGEGATVQVRLDWLPPRLRTSVVNGSGSAATAGAGLALSTGHGLIGLAERVQLVGGELETGPLPDGGFRIEATLPVSVAPREELETGPGDETHR